MIKVKSFFHTLAKSLVPQHEYYKSLLRVSFLKSFIYLITLLICINSITIVFFLTKLHPTELHGLLGGVEKSLSQYPHDQIYMINDGKLLSNANAPYFLWSEYNNDKNLLLVVDKTANPDKINEYNSTILITANKMVLRDVQSPETYKIIPLTVATNQTINAETILGVSNALRTIVNHFNLYLFLFVIGALILLPLVSIITTLFYLAIASVVAYVVYILVVGKGRMHSIRHVQFVKFFHLGLQAASLPLILDYGLNLLGLTSRPLPLLFLMLLTVFVFGGAYEAYYVAPSHTVSHPSKRRKS